MKSIFLLFFLSLPYCVFSQYSEEWKGNFNYDEKEKNCIASKVKIAPSKNLICVTSIGKTEKTMFTYFTLDGQFVKENRPYLFWEQTAFNNRLGMYDEQYQSLNSINKFDLNEAAIGFEFFCITRSKSYRKPFLMQLNLDTNQFAYVFYANDDTTTRTRSYSAILGNNFSAIIADTIWLGYGDIAVKIQNYFIKIQTVNPLDINKVLVLSADTISSDISIANPVPVAIKRSEDSSLVVVIASEEQESSQAVGVSCRIVDKNFQEVRRFFLPPELFNLNGKLLSIKDAIVTEKSIYFVGNVYSFNNSSNGIIAKCDLDGSNFNSTILSNEGSVLKSVEFINDSTLIAVGASKDITHNSNTHKFLVEFNANVDVRFTKEWSTTNLDTLYDIERVNDNEFIVVGSENGFPYIQKLLKNPITSVFYSSEVQANGGSLEKTYLYPNPTTNVVTVRFTPKSDEVVSFFLYDFTGNIVAQELISTVRANLENSFSFDLFQLCNGTYNVVLRQGTDVITTKLVIIN